MNNFKGETSEQKVQRLIGFNKKEKIGLGLLLLIIIIAPILLTQFSSFYSFNTNTGAIGDTIGGITAPFVNLLAAYLVYKSFAAQIKANKQQREDHDVQMKIITNEQSINYLLKLFDNMERDYITNEEGNNERGWAFQLSHGLSKLDLSEDPNCYYQDSDRSFDSTDQEAFKSSGNRQIREAIGPVNYIYHNFAMLTDALLNSTSKTSDKNVLYVVRYIASKVSHLFKSNNYSFLIDKDIHTYIDKGSINEYNGSELLIAKKTAIEINSRLIVIMKATQLMTNRKR